MKDPDIKLDRESTVPLNRQVYDELRRLIFSGTMKPGTRLPPTRTLAERLGLSRPTVSWAYEQLLSEGYLESFTGAGTFVSRDLTAEMLRAWQGNGNGKGGATTNKEQLAVSTAGKFFGEMPPFDYVIPRPKYDFREGTPAIEHIPMAQWRKLWTKHASQPDVYRLSYASDPRGIPALREAISEYLSRARAVRCRPEQVIVVFGTMQALSLITRLHMNPGDTLIMEEPGYHCGRWAFESFGVNVQAIAVDEAGLPTNELLAYQGKAKALYLTPSHQYPLGCILPLARRLQVLEWAKNSNAIVIEDDYDGEYRYSGGTIPSLQGLDPDGNVIYIGTFSKVLFPALRLGYMVVPERLIDTYAWAKKLSDNHCPSLDQNALADFIREGHLERHIGKMRMIYDKRRRAMLEAIYSTFGKQARILGDNAGMHVTLRLATGMTDDEVIGRAAARQVNLTTTRKNYTVDNDSRGEFLLSYANLSEDVIAEGIAEFAVALRNT